MRSVSRNCIIAASLMLATAFTGGFLITPSIAKKQQPMIVTSNPINKGDRLPITAATRGTKASPLKASSATKRPPLGCDPMFSPIADPAHAGLYGRCAA
jgi:hypothetical protein